MAFVQDILRTKGSQVFSVGEEATVLDAAIVMNEHKIGALVVIDHGKVHGIVTERDVLRHVVAERRDPARTRVAEIMTTEVSCAQPNTTIEEARSVMTHRRIRHLPVVNEMRELVGMISIGDVNAWDNNVAEVTIQHLHEYLYGRV